MAAKTKKPTEPAGVSVEHVPTYDPAVHVQSGQVVFAELYCACGSLWRQRDPVAYLAPMVADWISRHTGTGHGAASKADCVTAREQVREAAFQRAGKAAEYEPKDHPHLDTACTLPRPWPIPEGSS